MKRAIIFHGTQGSPEGNWFRWLEAQLIARGYEVWMPSLPHAVQPSLKEWVAYVQSSSPFPLDENVLVVGHSSGGILAMLLLQEGIRFAGVAVVSVFIDNSLGWEPNNELFDVPFAYEKMAQNPTPRIIINSDTDPYVPLEQAQTMAVNSHTELIVLEGQGHFNLEQSQDYTQFPKLIELLEAHKLV